MDALAVIRKGRGPEILLVHGDARPRPAWEALTPLRAHWTLAVVHRRARLRRAAGAIPRLGRIGLNRSARTLVQSKMSGTGSATSIEGVWRRGRTVRFAPAKLPWMPRLSLEEEGVLVERAQGGDRPAFEELVRRHADRLYAVVLRFLGEPREAEDVTQEAFLRAWRGIGGFKGRSQFYTWLYRIGLNEAKRRATRRPPPGRLTPLDDDPRAEVPDYSSAPQTRAAEAELREVLERAVRALAPDYREPLILRDVEGLSTAEAAEVMGLGEAAFKSRLHRARLAVREAIDEYLGEDR